MNSHSSLRTRLVQLVLLAVLPALGLIFYSAKVEHQSASVDAEADSLRSAKATAATLDRLIDDTRQLLITLARLPIVDSKEPRSCNAQLAELLQHYSEYSNFGAATPDGKLFCSALPLDKPINIGDRSYFQRAINERGFSVGEFQIGRRTGRPTINFAVPNFDKNGNVDSVIFAALDLAGLQRHFAETRTHEKATVTIIDQHGTVLARVPEPGRWVGKTIPELPIVKHALAVTEGVTAANGLDGVLRFYGFTTARMPASRGRIHIIVGIPADLALANARVNLTRNLAGLLIVALLSLAVAFWGGERFLLQPLGALVRATERLSGGDLSARTGLQRSRLDEVGRLAVSFDKMAAALEERHEEILCANQQIQRNLDRARALHEIELAINSTLDLRAMLALLLGKIDLVLPNAVTTIRLINKETDDLEPVGCRNIDEETWRREHVSSRRGVTQTILENRVPLSIANVQTDPRSPAPGFAKRYGLASYLGLPIIAKEEVLGVIGFFTKSEHEFSADEIDFLSTLTGQLGSAIHNTRLYEEARRSEAEASALHAITVAATQSLDLDLVLSEAIRKVTDIFHFDATRIFLFNGDKSELQIKAAFETNPESWLQANHFGRGESIAGYVAETGERLVFEDIDNDPRYRELSGSETAQSGGSRFLAMLPIITKGKIWGAMACAAATPRRLNAREIALLEAMNNQIGIAVENGTLYEQTAIKARELSMLYSIAGIASESLDVDLILRRIMEKVRQSFAFDAGRIYLCQGDRRELHLVYHEGFPAHVSLPKKYQIGEGLLGKAVETGEPRIIEDMRADRDYASRARNRVMIEAGFRSSFLIPIKARGQSLGALNFHRKETHHFSESDLQLIKAIADCLGVAVGNARLFSEIEKKSIELEKANKGKDEFLGIISHELRTPLNVIKGYTDLMLDGVFGKLNAEQRKALQKIANQGTDLFAMINGILQVTKIAADAVQPAAREIRPSDLLDEIRAYYDIPDGKEVTLSWEYPAGLPTLWSDDEKLKGVLQNLISNAIKFTEAGRVTISARSLPQSTSIEFKVADTGIGIPREKLDLVFDMFAQVDSSATRKYSGVGLGLYIVKKYTELLGGEVFVQSEVDRGSEFTVRLPVGQGAQPPPPGDGYMERSPSEL